MTDMEELKRRKMKLNLAIVHVDPDAFIANFMGWLEITAFISALRAGEAQVPADGITPALSAEKLRTGSVHAIGNDAIFAFCMTAALKGDKAAKWRPLWWRAWGRNFLALSAYGISARRSTLR